jgi:N-methylhydantoinase A
MEMAWIIGVDVGGTFTDFCVLESHTSAIHVHKTPSTPEQPARAIVEGLGALCAEHNIDVADIARLSHGTTVATNALLQRRGATVAVITTQGFQDLLEIGRQTRPHMFSLQLDHPTPLVPRERHFELAERITATGAVLRALTPEAVCDAVEQVQASGAEACAVCLLFSFVNPEHEHALARALEAVPGLHVSLSSEVRPEFREYERLSTTVLNAYLQPIIADYLHDLERDLKLALPSAALGINQSSGGLMSIDRARRFPIRTALSGPAAGTVGAVYTARQAWRPDVITLDMGGTSADVALVRGYETGTQYDREVGGFPVRLPMVDIHTVGAGGGSIAWLDRDGLLKVGPLSAGAAPGPACYGLGGDQPTVTDANLVLGRLSPQGLLDGAMPLDVDAARTALTPVAQHLGFSAERTAHGILGIVVSNMVRAIRAISVERGHDPRGFTLMPFGGAGPLHAHEVAAQLGMGALIVPPAPGILCAQGLVVSELKEDFVRTSRTRVEPASQTQIQAHIEALLQAGEAWRETEGLPPAQCTLRLTLDMRYVGQNFELSVPLAADVVERLTQPDGMDGLRHLFFDAHERQYGYHNPDDPVEIINYRVTAQSVQHRPPVATAPVSMPSAAPEPTGMRPVYFRAETALETPIYDRTTLLPGHRLHGPAVIEQLDATTLLFPEDELRVDAAYNLCIEVLS